jgi:NAD(P)-dependent dehydrogenase (short-subunit alcohol dehydrogenase family)
MGHVVVVTGGAGLLGKAFCSEIARRGGVPIVTDVDGDRAFEVAAQISADGGLVGAAQLDITERGAVDHLIRELRARYGRLDAVVNSAYPRNALYGSRLEDVTYESFCENVSLHLGGYFLVSQRFAEDFGANGGGNIVNMASVYGLVAPRFHLYSGTEMTMPVEYAATKAGVIHLTRYFAQYYKSRNVRCNAIAPGGIRDGQAESFTNAYDAMAGPKGLLDPVDVTGTLLYLLSGDSRHVNGQVVVVDDAWSL